MATTRHIRPNKERPPETLIEVEGCKVHITEGRIDTDTNRRFTTVEIIMKEGWEHDCRTVDNILIVKVVEYGNPKAGHANLFEGIGKKEEETHVSGEKENGFHDYEKG